MREAQLRTIAASFEATGRGLLQAAERHAVAVDELERSPARVDTAWRSPAADRLKEESAALADRARRAPEALTAAAAHARRLAELTHDTARAIHLLDERRRSRERDLREASLAAGVDGALLDTARTDLASLDRDRERSLATWHARCTAHALPLAELVAEVQRAAAACEPDALSRASGAGDPGASGPPGVRSSDLTSVGARVWGAFTSGVAWVEQWGRDHLVASFGGGRLLWRIEQAREWLVGGATPPATPFDDAAGLLEVLRPYGVSDPPRDPGEVTAVFATLSPRQAERLARDAPDTIGALDGTPPAVRDVANRLLLDREITRIEARLSLATASFERRRAALLRDPPSGRHDVRPAMELFEAQRALEALQRTLADLTRLSELLGERRTSRAPARRSEPRQLLLFDASRGHVAVATGRVDAATHVTTFVPGAGSTPGKVPVYVEDLERLRQRAARFAPTGRHATVVWLGYDAPPHLIAATRPEPAQRGGPAFASFLDGLRATNRAAHLVAAGHSYGSTVIGEAAATAGLDADAVLLVASPGARAASVRDYALPDGSEVFVATDTAWLPREDRVGGDVIRFVSSSAATSALGPDPVSPRFGAIRLDVGDGGWHAFSGYAAEGSVSLDALARIAAGRPQVPTS